MKKCNFTRLLACALVVFQIFALTAVFTVGASAETANSYVFNYTSKVITLDGTANEDAWNDANAAQNFSFLRTYSTSGLTTQTDYAGSWKGIWSVEDGKACLYFVIEIADATASKGSNEQFIFSVDETNSNSGSDVGNISVADESTQKFRTSGQALTATSDDTIINVGPNSNTDHKNRVYYHVNVNQNGDTQTGYTVEGKYVFSTKHISPDFKMNIILQDTLDSNNNYGRYIWCGTDGNAQKFPSQFGTCRLGGAFETLDGVSVRFLEPTGLRFENQINKAYYDALIAGGATVETGTIILPTDKIPTDGFTTMDALGTAGTDYLKVVNTNNEWANSATAETDGYYTYYGSIVGIKEGNYSRKFSGIGYISVTKDGVTTTTYSVYSEEDHSRSIVEIAAGLIESNPTKYAKGTTEGDILRGYLPAGHEYK